MTEDANQGESYSQRLKRFQSGVPIESIGTLMNSINNYFNKEITEASRNRQTCLLFLGVHASILTISKILFNKEGLEGYKYFLEKFVDGETEDLKFSLIASRIHEWRNILAHQWLGRAGHDFGYNYDIQEGWKYESGVLYVNPQIYYDRYINVFFGDTSLWDFESYLSADEQEESKDRIIKKFARR